MFVTHIVEKIQFKKKKNSLFVALPIKTTPFERIIKISDKAADADAQTALTLNQPVSDKFIRSVLANVKNGEE